MVEEIWLKLNRVVTPQTVTTLLLFIVQNSADASSPHSFPTLIQWNESISTISQLKNGLCLPDLLILFDPELCVIVYDFRAKEYSYLERRLAM